MHAAIDRRGQGGWRSPLAVQLWEVQWAEAVSWHCAAVAFSSSGLQPSTPPPCSPPKSTLPPTTPPLPLPLIPLLPQSATKIQQKLECNLLVVTSCCVILCQVRGARCTRLCVLHSGGGAGVKGQVAAHRPRSPFPHRANAVLCG